MIYWTAFKWEAFATLMTGFIAVAATWSVGRRQIDILGKQNSDAREASNRDFAIREQSFRIDLLNHRYDFIKEFRRFWGQWQKEMAIA